MIGGNLISVSKGEVGIGSLLLSLWTENRRWGGGRGDFSGWRMRMRMRDAILDFRLGIWGKGFCEYCVL